MESPKERNLLRDLNIALVADLLRRHQPISRVDLADKARLGRSTITGITAGLLTEGLAVEVGEAESTGGRRPVLLELRPGARLIACARLAPRTVALGLADLNGNLVVRHRRALRGQLSPDEVLSQLVTWVVEMLREFGPERRRVVALGLAVPGRVDLLTGTVYQAQPLGWEHSPVRERLEKALGFPVLVENDTNAFLLGERQHLAPTLARDLVGITLGHQVGGALLVDGRLGRGVTGGGGGFGHVQVDADGPPCWCGRIGCLEAMVSDGALVAQARQALDRGAATLLLDLVEGMPHAITREVLVAAAQEGDRLSIRLLQQAGQRVGRVLAEVVNGLNPAAVVVGGEAVDQAGPLLLEPIREAFAGMLVPWAAPTAMPQAAVLGENAWLMGAAQLVLEQIFRLPVPRREDGYDSLSIANWIPEE